MSGATEVEAARRDLAQRARQLESEDVEIIVRSHASPARVVLALAAELEVDLIVTGTHSRTGIDRFLMGSVADKVVRGARCSVLVVPAAGAGASQPA